MKVHRPRSIQALLTVGVLWSTMAHEASALSCAVPSLAQSLQWSELVVRGRVISAAPVAATSSQSAFEIQVLLPEDGAGERLEFPVLQTCVEGETAWNESAADGAEPEHPAPAIEVTAAEGDGNGHGDEAAEPASAETTAGSEDPTEAAVDTFARVVGIGGLAVGVAGLIVAIMARRGSKA